MKRLVVAFAAAGMLVVTIPAQAQKTPPPDYSLRCKNGKFAKVWLSPIKVDNKCGDHDKEWVEFYHQYGDEDVYVTNIAGGAKWVTREHIDKRENGPDGWGDRVYVTLDRGMFCGSSYAFSDINGIETIYRPGSTWRATCPAPPGQ